MSGHKSIKITKVTLFLSFLTGTRNRKWSFFEFGGQSNGNRKLRGPFREDLV